MGLDAYLYKQPKDQLKLVKECKKAEELVYEKVDSYLESIKVEKGALIDKFIDKHKEVFIKPENAKYSLTMTSDSIIIFYDSKFKNEVDFELTEKMLFAGYKVFKADLSNTEKYNLAKEFKTSIEHLCVLDNKAEVQRVKELDDYLEDRKTELAYWRNNYDLNKFIIENHKVEDNGNNEYIELTEDDLVDILKFITDQEEDTNDVAIALKEWSDDLTYVYYAWW